MSSLHNKMIFRISLFCWAELRLAVNQDLLFSTASRTWRMETKVCCQWELLFLSPRFPIILCSHSNFTRQPWLSREENRFWCLFSDLDLKMQRSHAKMCHPSSIHPSYCKCNNLGFYIFLIYHNPKCWYLTEFNTNRWTKSKIFLEEVC